ncbi:unnamed protein product [Euphydryas editha]|uniref:Uncharacterized protein n=1 Tax=Euphydryas editha TaxID=104508 RepID=A0AAU9UAE8_EUPED|nr:unnamed protein product [Euphydryas editha]
MLTEACGYIIYTATVLSLFLIDYLLGNGFVATSQSLFCKVACAIRKYIEDEEKHGQITGNEYGINLPVLVTEIVVLGLTIRFLNKYKQHRGKDRIDDLLQESREALRQTNEFLEKWRLRRMPSEYSYLDEEPQEIKPLKLEVPILHMAIIDTLGTTRNRTERGDAGDMVNFTDSTLLSVTSLLDDDLQSIPELPSDEKIDLSKDLDIRDRYLWDVLEEDASLENL